MKDNTQERAKLMVAHMMHDEKTLHVTVPFSVYEDLRTTLFRCGNVSIQAVFREMVDRIVSNDPTVMQFIEELREKRLTSGNLAITKTDVEDLFSIIERSSPLTGG
jgi:hypothetical protein